MVSVEQWLIYLSILLFAGTVKGVAGLGLPAIAISLMVLFFDAHLSLGLIVLPLFFSNLLQAFQSGQFRWVITRFWPFLISIAMVIYFSSSYAHQVDEKVIYFLIAISIGLFLVSQKKLNSINLEKKSHVSFAVIAGSAAGILGGLTTVWGPPTIIYLRMLGLDKEKFVTAAGWMFLMGTLPLIIGYWSSGILTKALLPAGMAGSVVAMIGVLIGKSLRPRFTEKRFVLLIDVMLGLMALNLLRRALGF